MNYLLLVVQVFVRTPYPALPGHFSVAINNQRSRAFPALSVWIVPSLLKFAVIATSRWWTTLSRMS